MKNSTPSEHPFHPLLQPRPLQKGDTIGLVAPAGPPTDEAAFTHGVRILHELGFRTRFARDLWRTDDYLAGSDEARAAEFNELWADREVKAIMAVRGGYGSLRLVECLNYDLIRRQPKILLGFSDISVLLNAVHRFTGLTTLHGPVVTTLSRIDRRSLQALINCLTGRQGDIIKPRGLEILKNGHARGPLAGGNLTTLAHLTATPYEPHWNGVVLFLEDVGEAPYRMDRLLTHLRLAGRLDRLAGLILGTFTADLTGGGDEDHRQTEQVWKRVLELSAPLDIPVWANFPVGHGRRNQTLPVGVEAVMDSGAGALRLMEPPTIPAS